MRKNVYAIVCFLVLAAGGVSLAAPGPEPPTPARRTVATATTQSQQTLPQTASSTGSAAVASRQDQALLELQFCRVSGDISGETSLTDNLWEGIQGEKVEAVKGPFVFFTLANLTVAGVKLKADENGWTWDGQDRPATGKKVELIASPRVMVAMPNTFVISVGSPQPVQYFEKRADGLFELKTTQEEVGLRISARVEKGEAERIVLRDLTIGLRSIEKRKAIEGVQLDVGQPIVETREQKITVAVKPGRLYGIELLSEGYGCLLMRLRVDSVTGKSR